MKTKVNNLQEQIIRPTSITWNLVWGLKYKITWDIFVFCVSTESDEKSTCNAVVLDY